MPDSPTALDRIRELLAEGEREEPPESAPEVRPRVDTGVTRAIREDESLALLAAKSDHNRARIAGTRAELRELVIEMAGERPPDERFRKIETKVKWVHWLLVAVLIPALSAIYLTGKYLYDRGIQDQRANDRLDTIEREIGELRSFHRSAATTPKEPPHDP